MTKNVSVHLLSSRPVHQQREIVNRLGIARDISGYHQKGDGWNGDIHIDDEHACELGDKTIIVRFK